MNSKSIILVAIDSKYTHTNPAVRTIAAFARNKGITEIEIAEFTVNQHTDTILNRLYDLDGGVYLFSCYIWNIHTAETVARELAKIRPDALIFAGGPETSWNSGAFLQRNPAFNGVLRGEGEESATELLERWRRREDPTGCPGLVLRTAAGLVESPLPPPVDMDLLPFPYPDLDGLDNRALHYESMRGCPFSCAYCLSSTTSGVRFRSPKLVCGDMQRFLDAKVRRVKFVDRTFNCKKDHALTIWHYIRQHDNGVTNFHFELAGDLLDEEMLTFLSDVRPGLFQFEIGVQSTYQQTLEEICRPTRLDKLSNAVRMLLGQGNIHLHLDLIAGLPMENLNSFIDSFNHVYALGPHQLQLGFLKVLGGSAIHRKAEEYGLVYRSHAPYEVLATKWLNYDDLAILKATEQALDLYYNSGRFRHIIRWLCGYFESPFTLYRALGELYRQLGYHHAPPGKIQCYELLAKLMRRMGISITPEPQWLCKFDMMLHEKIKALPSWVTVDGCLEHKDAIRRFYSDPEQVCRYLPGYDSVSARQLERLTHMEAFPFNPVTGARVPCVVLVDYHCRDVDGRAGVTILPCHILGF